MHKKERITTSVSPAGSLDVLSQHEVSKLRDASASGLHELLRRCCLAVLSAEKAHDDALALMNEYANFDVNLIQEDRGLKLELVNAPSSAFVDSKMISGVREQLFAVLRDIIYVSNELEDSGKYNLNTSSGITNFVFHILRNANILRPRKPMDIVVCWGGHSINRDEYDYSKEVGYQLGLRHLNICTGCGSGAMKGPMKGATIAHAKQRMRGGRYIGITEPGIIAAEPPNPIVSELVIMPDMEKRLEAFARVGHGVIVFPGGVGTTEEILYLLGILSHPDNSDLVFPLILTGPACSAEYFRLVDDFVSSVLGEKVQQLYQIIIDDPEAVAVQIKLGLNSVAKFRKKHSDAYYFNWRMKIDTDFQVPFKATHENMASLKLHWEQNQYELIANLRRAFSGLVTGNVKESGINTISQRGPFKINGDMRIMQKLDTLLEAFVRQERMRLPGIRYIPCYKLAS